LKNFEYRNYSSRTYRPHPIVEFQPQEGWLAVATPWGRKSASEKALNMILEYYKSATADVEVTSPFEHILSLKKEANLIRNGALLANESIYKNDNLEEYTSGSELLVLLYTEGEMHILQVGQPSLYLFRKSLGIQPISNNLDLSMSIGVHRKQLSPLPSKLLGIEKNIDLSVHSFTPLASDKLILLSRSYTPETFYQLKNTHINLDSVTRAISKENTELPFWLGLLDF